jgi:hypothetical protein
MKSPRPLSKTPLQCEGAYGPVGSKSDGPVISDVYENTTGSGGTIAFSAPAAVGGRFSGVVGLDILLDELNDLTVVASISVGGTERAELLANARAQRAAEPGMLSTTSKLTLPDGTVLYAVPESEVVPPEKAVDYRELFIVTQCRQIPHNIAVFRVAGIDPGIDGTGGKHACMCAESISVPLTAIAVEKERISVDLDVATRIQSSILRHITLG